VITYYLIAGGIILTLILAWLYLLRRVTKNPNLDNDCTRGGGSA
jgi:hypothetical protein